LSNDNCDPVYANALGWFRTATSSWECIVYQ